MNTHESQAIVLVKEEHPYNVELSAFSNIEYLKGKGQIRVEIPYDGSSLNLKENFNDIEQYEIGNLIIKDVDSMPHTTNAIPLAHPTKPMKYPSIHRMKQMATLTKPPYSGKWHMRWLLGLVVGLYIGSISEEIKQKKASYIIQRNEQPAKILTAVRHLPNLAIILLLTEDTHPA